MSGKVLGQCAKTTVTFILKPDVRLKPNNYIRAENQDVQNAVCFLFLGCCFLFVFWVFLYDGALMAMFMQWTAFHYKSYFIVGLINCGFGVSRDLIYLDDSVALSWHGWSKGRLAPMAPQLQWVVVQIGSSQCGLQLLALWLLVARCSL